MKSIFIVLVAIMCLCVVTSAQTSPRADPNGPLQIKVKKQDDIWAKYKQARSEAAKLLNGRLVTVRLYDD